MTMRKNEGEIKGKNPVLAVIVSALAAFVLTAVIFIIYAALLTYTGVTEKYALWVACGAVGAGVLLGGFLTGRAVKKRGIVWGILTGALYGGGMVLLGRCLSPDFAFGVKTAVIGVVCVCGGGLGGVFGVNA